MSLSKAEADTLLAARTRFNENAEIRSSFGVRGGAREGQADYDAALHRYCNAAVKSGIADAAQPAEQDASPQDAAARRFAANESLRQSFGVRPFARPGDADYQAALKRFVSQHQ